MEEDKPASGIPPGSWPVPLGLPLYVTVEHAAKLAGVSYECMRAWASSMVDPIPHIAAGRVKKLIRTAAIPAYLETKEER